MSSKISDTNLAAVSPEQIVARISAVSSNQQISSNRTVMEKSEGLIPKVRERLAVSWKHYLHGRSFSRTGSPFSKFRDLVFLRRTKTHDETLSALENVIGSVDILSAVTERLESVVADRMVTALQDHHELGKLQGRTSNLEQHAHNVGVAITETEHALSIAGEKIATLEKVQLESAATAVHAKSDLQELSRSTASNGSGILSLVAQVQHLSSVVKALELKHGEQHAAHLSLEAKTLFIEEQAKLDRESLERSITNLFSAVAECMKKIAGHDEMRTAIVTQSEGLQELRNSFAGVATTISDCVEAIDKLTPQFRDLMHNQHRLRSEDGGEGKQSEKTIVLDADRILIKTKFGFSLIMDSRDMSFTSKMLLNGEWEPHLTRHLLRTLKPGQVFCDFGANVGYFTALATTLVGGTGRIFSFEANTEVFSLLNDNVRMNDYGHVCDTYNLALAQKREVKTFRKFRRNLASSTLAVLPDRLLANFKEKPDCIEIMTSPLLREFFGDISDIHGAKMDLEGAESLVFEGARELFVELFRPGSWIIMEFNPSALIGCGSNPKTFFDLLEDMGFKIERFEGESAVPVGSFELLDAWRNSDLLLTVSEKGLK